MSSLVSKAIVNGSECNEVKYNNIVYSNISLTNKVETTWYYNLTYKEIVFEKPYAITALEESEDNTIFNDFIASDSDLLNDYIVLSILYYILDTKYNSFFEATDIFSKYNNYAYFKNNDTVKIISKLQIGELVLIDYGFINGGSTSGEHYMHMNKIFDKNIKNDTLVYKYNSTSHYIKRTDHEKLFSAYDNQIEENINIITVSNLYITN